MSKWTCSTQKDPAPGGNQTQGLLAVRRQSYLTVSFYLRKFNWYICYIIVTIKKILSDTSIRNCCRWNHWQKWNELSECPNALHCGTVNRPNKVYGGVTCSNHSAPEQDSNVCVWNLLVFNSCLRSSGQPVYGPWRLTPGLSQGHSPDN